MKNFLTTKLKVNILMAAMLFVALFAFSCDNNDDDDNAVPVNNGNENLNIVQVLETFDASMKTQSFNTLQAALESSGLASAVSSSTLTLFAPTDAAFEAIGITPENVSSVENLSNILLYHVIEGQILSSQLSNKYVPTLGGAAVEINLDNGAKVNDAQVAKADIRAENGVIHAIDKVILPPTMNLVELAISLDPEFSILVQAVVKADLAETLAEGGPFTVFAPTNAAFASLLEELEAESLDDIPVDVLTEVLLYHVVEGRVYSSDLQSGEVNSLNGTFTVDVNDLTITDANSREAALVTSLLNVQATNGVIHVIDRVILP